MSIITPWDTKAGTGSMNLSPNTAAFCKFFLKQKLSQKSLP
jgi:hypothetical protein